MNERQKKGCFGIITTVLSLLISAIMAYVAVMTYMDNKQLKKDVENLKQEIIYKDEELEKKRQLYQESLSKYALTYKELLAAGSAEIDKYNEFVYGWGPLEFKDRFPEERARRFNNVKGIMDAILEHVNRYRRILVPFSRSLNGRIERMRDDLSEDDEQSILRSFEALNSGVRSQIEALELELKALSRGD